MQQLQADPLWDEGISTFLLGEYDAKGEPLTIDDLQAYANKQAVRVGDLLETLFLMAIFGSWNYLNAEGKAETLNEDALDELYAKGRLSPEDLKAFSGVWMPVLPSAR